MSFRSFLLLLAAACSPTGTTDEAEVPPSRIQQPVELAQPVVGGAPPVSSRAEDVDDLVTRRTPRAVRCHEDSPFRESTVRAELRLRVRPTGEVSVEGVTTDTDDDAALGECLRDVFQSAYVHPVDDEAVEVRALVFRAPTPDNAQE